MIQPGYFARQIMFMKAVLTALLLSLLTLSAGAQGGDEFCDGIEKIIAASPVRFLDLQDAYELPGVGVGKDAVTLGVETHICKKRRCPGGLPGDRRTSGRVPD
jgi:hypothetical protein